MSKTNVDSYELPNWPDNSPKWKDDLLKLLKESSTKSKPEESLENLIKTSDSFSIPFPIDTIRCKSLISAVKKETLEKNIQSAYPVIHEHALYLYAKFILHKRKFGTSVEKQLYKSLNLTDLIQRFLTKRAVMFMGKYDQFILLNGEKGSNKWDTIGKDHEKSPLLLKDYISYDEIKLSALLSVSSYSYFINNGFRKNKGIVAKSRADLEEEGVIIGLIGARLKRKNAMEYQEIVISKTQNTDKNGYGDNRNSLHKVFADFYEEPCYSYNEMVTIANSNPKRFTKLQGDDYFDNVVYAKRLAISFDTLLLEANQRAKEKDKFAYIHLVGIGLGVWRAADHQETVFVETFLNRLNVLNKILQNISDIHFAYFAGTTSCGKYKNGDVFPIEGHPKGGIKLHISKREPYTRIGHKDKLLVVSYAWDGNAQPGNEFWKGMLGSTGDSSTASSSQVSELHNPHINKLVCAENLMVVTPKGHFSINEYINTYNKRSYDEENESASSSKNKKGK